MPQKTLAVLLTCFNRKEKTLQCLDSLYQQDLQGLAKIEVYLVDDGCTDGTGEAVSKKHPQTHVLKGDGSLYWNGGMNLAMNTAMQTGYDYYLWLNDDTFLYDRAIFNMLETDISLQEKGDEKNIIVGPTLDPDSKEISYGGLLRRSYAFWNPIKCDLVHPNGTPQICTTFTGNIVLISKAVADLVGPNDPVYTHRWGDVDYGLRAKKYDCKVWSAKEYVGECEANPFSEGWQDASLSLKKRYQLLHATTGINKKDWPTFVRRHCGIYWPLVWSIPYIKIPLTSFSHTLKFN